MKNNNYNWLQKLTDIIENFFLNIFEHIGLKKFVIWYKKNQEAMRYLIFGGLITVVNVVMFMILKSIGLSTLTSNTIAWIVSVIFAYITNKYCVFNSIVNTKKELFKEFTSFIGCRIFTLIIDEVFMWLTIDKFKLNSLIMKILSNVIVIILNYIFSKILIFKEKQTLK